MKLNSGHIAYQQADKGGRLDEIVRKSIPR